jgi:hypothetical protein
VSRLLWAVLVLVWVLVTGYMLAVYALAVLASP